MCMIGFLYIINRITLNESIISIFLIVYIKITVIIIENDMSTWSKLLNIAVDYMLGKPTTALLYDRCFCDNII